MSGIIAAIVGSYSSGGDPYAANVKAALLLDGNATDTKGHTFTDTGVTYTSSPAKFGQSATLNGTNYGIYHSLGHNDFLIGTSEFTLDCWIYPTSFATRERGIFQNGNSASSAGNSGVGLAYNVSGTSTSNVFLVRDGNFVDIPSATISLNTWAHIALVRRSGNLYVYVDGVQKYTEANTTNYSIENFLRFGGYYSSLYTMVGNIDDCRLTMAARWSANFTPPTSPIA